MGIELMFEISQPPKINTWYTDAIDPGLPYFSISIALNLLLTLMIIIRLALHVREIRDAMGIIGTGGLYKAIVTMLIESCALYTVNQLLFIVTWTAGNVAVNIFLPSLGQTQVYTFPRLGSLHGLSNVTMDRTGHCSTAHHSTSRKQERVDEQQCCFRTYQ